MASAHGLMINAVLLASAMRRLSSAEPKARLAGMHLSETRHELVVRLEANVEL
jgi:hypothetical protein